MSKRKKSTEEDLEKRKQTEKKVVRSIIDNYTYVGKSLAQQLALSTPNHNLTTGTYREEIWLSLFEQIIPRKFCIDQGVFIMDSFGGISNEVDIAIFDEQYTPYIFKYGKIKFIPIEAVAVAIQCKSTNTNDIKPWADSIKRLKTSLDSVVRTMYGLGDNNLEKSYQAFCNAEPDDKNKKKKAQTSTRPILILCALDKKGTPDHAKKDFDIILNVNEKGELSKFIPDEEKDLVYWNSKLNHYDLNRYEEAEKYKELANMNIQEIERKLSDLKIIDPDTEKENIILSLTFQLNQLLMLINNPIFFPHFAYVQRFNKI